VYTQGSAWAAPVSYTGLVSSSSFKLVSSTISFYRGPTKWRIRPVGLTHQVPASVPACVSLLNFPVPMVLYMVRYNAQSASACWIRRKFSLNLYGSISYPAGRQGPESRKMGPVTPFNANPTTHDAPSAPCKIQNSYCR
jgi:hypothetical protein